MAVVSIRRYRELGTGLALAPERFDPRRTALWAGTGPVLGALVEMVRQTIVPHREHEGKAGYLPVDTSDAKRGFLDTRRSSVSPAELGSTKKLARPGDVLVSRLRPYLQQVAYVDGGAPGLSAACQQLACSTEFFVLRARDQQSIAFLVPYLLSPRVQEILAAAQEGGHHPRVAEATVLGLTVPDDLLAQRDRLSDEVEQAVMRHRHASLALDCAIDATNDVLGQCLR